MGDLSKDFSRSEYTCKCGCGFDTVDTELNRVMQDLRDYYGRRVTIISGCRCFSHNFNIPGAAKDSWHQFGKANDFVVDGVSAIEIFSYLNSKYPSKYGIGLYQHPARVHLDVRPYRARWKMD